MAIQIRRGTNTEWESNNSNIVVGEPAIATDAERFFVGTASGDYAEFANLDVIAPAYDTSASYVVGDVINRQGKLYSCNTPCSGTFNVSYWDEKSLAEILKDLENEIDYAQYEIGYADGELITINNGASEIPVKDLTLGIEAVQSGSGDPSPTNIRPISGWDEVNVTRTGKNLLVSTSLKNGVYISNTTGAEVSYGSWSASDYIPMQINTRYRLLRLNNGNYTPVVGSNLYWAGYDKNFNYVTGGIGDGLISSNSAIKYMRVSASTANLTKGVLVLDSDMDDFVTEADYIDGTTYTIDLDGTRYGGTLDVTTGVLTITHGFKIFNGTETWGTELTTNFYSQSGRGASSSAISGDKVWCSHAPSITPSASVSYLNCYISTTGNFNIQIPNSIVPHTGTDMKSWVLAQYNNGTPLTIRYELVTPQVVQLTPTQVRTVLGTNNLWNQMNSNNELAYRISNALN